MTQKMIFNLPIQAGVYTEETERGAQGRWFDADKVRFRKGLPEKIGGWVQMEPQFLGKCRRIVDWSSLDGRKWTALGTDLKLYLWQDETLYDITPIRREVTLGNNPFATTSGSITVVVSDVAHGAQVGDFVRFTGATAVAGITIDGEYRVIEVVDPDSYTIEADVIASSTTTGGGAAVEAIYDITIGSESATSGRGYSTGGYSNGTYSTPRTVTETIIPLRTWALDTWGEDLIASPNGGAIYWWDRTTGPLQRAVKLELGGAPHVNRFVIVSQSNRQLIALGAYDTINNRDDPLLIRWCSQENFHDWIPTVVNTAGDMRVFTGSKFVTALRTRGEIAVFTNTTMYALTLLAAGHYGLTTLGENVSIISANAGIAVDFRIFFMGEADFYVYDGVLRVLNCDVRNFVYENLTTSQKDKIYCGLNREFNEIWWFYPARHGESWIEVDLSLSAESTVMDIQDMTPVVAAEGIWAPDFWSPGFWVDDFWGEGGVLTFRYAVQFNSGGYVELTTSPSVSSPYDAVYMLANESVIEEPLECEFESTFTLASINDMTTGIAFHITDLSGALDTAADNIKALTVEINPADNTLLLRKRLANGTVDDMDNAAASYDLGALGTPITLTAGNMYGLIAQRSSNTIRAYFWDEETNTTQLVAIVALSVGEIADYIDGTAGVILWGADGASSVAGAVQLHSFRAADAGILVDLDERGISTEVNRYVLFNYEENTWSIGTMSRTAWHDRSPVLEKAYAAGADGYIYKHETGVDDDGAAMEAFIQSYMMEIPEAGEQLMHVDKLIPDFLTLEGSVDVSLSGRRYPQSDTLIEKGPFTVTPSTEKISTRIKARQIALRLESSDVGDRWRSGRWRGQAGAHGKR